MPFINPISEWTLQFAKFILHEIPNGFISNIIVAERRRGKSVYVMKNFAKVYKTLDPGLSDEECYFKAFNCFIFGPDELTNKVFKNTKEDIVDPCWCIDDATVHFNPMVFFMNPFQYALLGGIFDTIGTVVNCLALTCPKKKRLMGGLKSYDDFTTQIHKAREGGYERIAKCVFWYTWPDDSMHWRRAFVDNYSCYLPDYIYIPYLEKRKKYLKVTNDKFMFLQKRLEQNNFKRFSGLDVMKKDLEGMISDIGSEVVNVKEEGDGTVS